jgi:hypothetical protein
MMVLLHRRCLAHHVRGRGPRPVPGQAARAGADVAFVQAIFLPHDVNCFALYQARSTSDVTAAGSLAGLRCHAVTTRSSATDKPIADRPAAEPHSSPVACVISFPILSAHQRGPVAPRLATGIALGVGDLAGAYTGARLQSRLPDVLIRHTGDRGRRLAPRGRPDLLRAHDRLAMGLGRPAAAQITRVCSLTPATSVFARATQNGS